MKYYRFIFILFFLISAQIFSQSENLNQEISLNATVLQQQFVKASIQEKKDILPLAIKVGDSAGGVFAKALVFVVENYELLGSNDSDLYNLALSAAENAWHFSDTSEIIPYLIRLFPLYDDVKLRTALFKDFSQLRKHSLSAENISAIVSLTNGYVSKASDFFSTQKLSSEKEIEIISAIETLGTMADPSSFYVLFKCITLKYNEEIYDASVKAINNITVNYQENIISMIEEKSPQEKLLAYQISVKNENISSFVHGEIAEKALSVAINNIVDTKNNDKDLIELQLQSMIGLAQGSWTKAAKLAVSSFMLAQNQLENSQISEKDFITIIGTLQFLASVETSQALSNYLGVLNSKMELNDSYSENIMLAVIKVLGALGDKVSFDYLLAVTYLDYSSSIIDAARNALAGLKW